MSEMFGNVQVTKEIFFTGIFENNTGTAEIQELNLTIFNIIKFVIWEFKWAKKNLDRNSFTYRVNPLIPRRAFMHG
jgi:hypothetical protein